MIRLSRRQFLQISASSAAALVVSAGLAGCSSDDDNDGGSDSLASGRFDHGVASGDPLAESVIIWTRVSPTDQSAASDALTVSWQVATDADFSVLVRDGNTTVSAQTDYTLKVDVQGLQPGTDYYYRFLSGEQTSTAGRLRTLPVAEVSQVRLLVASCSNYPAGYFHAYAEAALESDLDAVVHLGDYIYEYGADGYATEDAESLGRELAEDNAEELLTLDDYRKRYQLYRTDADLQALHAAAPFIAVWDDHEVSNDAWREGAENHNEDPAVDEGLFSERRQQALQAYFEWMPIRPASADNIETIYRQFAFGDLVNLMMLDTRIIGRDEQLQMTNYINADTGAFDTDGFAAALTDPNRTLLGSEQLAWLQSSMAASTAAWQVLGQQVLMGRMNIPAEVLLSPDDPTILGTMATIKARQLQGDPTLTAEEIARLEQSIPYNLDAWDGYAVEREAVLGTAVASDSNLVVLAGDTHNGWANTLHDMNGTAVGVEFATASISSPGLEGVLGIPDTATSMQAEAALELLIDDLAYLNANQRGYMVVTFTADEARADWRYVSTVKSQTYSLDGERARSLAMLPGAGNRSIVA